MESLYNRVTGDEDARVCKDIPEKACHDQPRNFFAYLWANLLGKIADEIASAKLIIPWLFGMLGVPAAYTGFLVPIREAGVLLPQLVVAAAIRHMPIRKGVWIVGSILSALSLLGMAVTAVYLQGSSAGMAFLAMLVVFSLSRGLCSVSAKDVLGKTVSKTRRGALMGWSASLSGLAVLAVGIWLGNIDLKDSGINIFATLFFAGGILWIAASFAFALIREQPGATEGGGNTLTVAVAQLSLLKTDQNFRQFVIARTLLLSVALAPPFYVLIAQQTTQSGLLGLGALIIANGLAASLSAPFWGYMSDHSSRFVMSVACIGASILGVSVYLDIWLNLNWLSSEIGLAVAFLILNIVHGGARLGRKVYLVDMANADNRAAYVAVSNTVIGVMMLLGGIIGFVGNLYGAASVVLILALCSLLAAIYIRKLPETID